MKIGVSVVSLTTAWSFVPGLGMPLIDWVAKKAGFSFLQALPLRWVSLGGLNKLNHGGLPTFYAEPAWNPTTWLKHFRGELGGRGVPTKFQDPLFFPNPQKSGNRFRTIVLGHGVVPVFDYSDGVPMQSLVEVHPGLGLPSSELACKARRNGFRLVLDTYHIIQVERDKEGFRSLEEVCRDMDVLMPEVRLIHVQCGNGQDWIDFLGGKPNSEGSLPKEVLKYAFKLGYSGDIVIEYRPMSVQGPIEFLSPWALADTLGRINKRVEVLW